LRRSDLVVLAFCAVVVGLLYSNASHADPLGEVRYFGHKYYAWQAESWMQGQLDLGKPAPAELLALPDPYDPEANRPFRFAGERGVHDLSLYHGKLYLYWGPAPVLVAFLPWRIVTGQALPCPMAAVLFAGVGWCATALLVVRAARRYCPNGSPAVLAIALLGLAGSNWAIVVLARASVWETPIFAACCFGAITWWLLAECHWAGAAAKPAWLAGASALWGLAIGSRPIWIIATLILLWPLWPERTQWRQRGFLRLAVAAVLPVTTCVLALLWHNYARFGSILEFGQHYQLADVRMAVKSVFSPSAVLFNLQNYFFATPGTGAYFPFLVPRPIGAAPPGYLGIDFTFGLPVVVPYLWCALLVFVCRAGREIITPVVATFVGLAGILSLFAGAAYRYELELATPLALLASLGVIACCPTGRLSRALYFGGALVLVVASTLSTMAVSSRMITTLWGEQTPHPWLGRVANHVATAVGWAPSAGTSGVEMDIVLPPWQNGLGAETLVASGRPPTVNAIMIDYPVENHIRFHYFHDTLHTMSAPIRVAPSARHRVRIEWGALLPPPNHPFWGGRPASEIELRRSQLRITWDEAVLTAPVPNSAPIHSEPAIGRFVTDEGPKWVFTGQILESRIMRTDTL
jgi:hypothetical protein